MNGPLRELPFDTLKIDSAYSRSAVTSPIDRTIVRVLVNIAHEIGALTVAECVESEQVAAELGDLGVDYGQGFHFGRPTLLTAEECA